jgi:hypothetical protein
MRLYYSLLTEKQMLYYIFQNKTDREPETSSQKPVIISLQ